MKNLKDIKIAMRHFLLSDEIKQQIEHTNKKVIDLDDTGQSSSEIEMDYLEHLTHKQFDTGSSVMNYSNESPRIVN